MDETGDKSTMSTITSWGPRETSPASSGRSPGPRPAPARPRCPGGGREVGGSAGCPPAATSTPARIGSSIAAAGGPDPDEPRRGPELGGVRRLVGSDGRGVLDGADSPACPGCPKETRPIQSNRVYEGSNTLWPGAVYPSGPDPRGRANDVRFSS